jgi:ATP-dependent Clp protease ATP-binding subunit ClpB
MQRDQMTRNSQQALQSARQLALDRGHAEIDAEHLLLALLEQPDGLIPNLLEKLNIKGRDLHQQLEQILARRARVSGSGQETIYLSSRLDRMLTKAQREAESLKDEYISVEHLLLGLLSDEKSSELGRLFGQYSLTRNRLLEVLAEVRGHQRVTSEDPESTYQVLESTGATWSRLCGRANWIR